ncbi:MAG: hypothetical protein LC674_00395, partial [Actinobacteria bacterium]|nr:hypothetical protein [Actinomycetota bacterium]
PIPFTNKKRLVFEATLPIAPPVSVPRKLRTETLKTSPLLSDHTLHSPSSTALAGKESEEECTPAAKVQKAEKRSKG